MTKLIQPYLTLIATALFLAACSYTPIYTEPQGPVPDRSERPSNSYPPVEEASSEAEEIDKPPPRVAVATPESVDNSRNVESRSGSASSKLRLQAETASDAGDHSRAESILNRALRIAPHEAATYYQLALVKLRQGSPAKALQFARKGLSLGPEDEMRERLRVIEADAEAQAQ